MPNIDKKIKEIKFSLLSPSEIKAISVAEIIYPEIVDTNGENKIGGLSDPRMGPIDLNTLCPTCNQTCDICPGHFGHIELAEPVFHIHFFQIIQKLLRCICWKCSNLLINPSDQMDNIHSGKIEEVIYHGDHTRVRINLLGNNQFILKVPNSSANLDIKLGKDIKIGWNSEDARALDPS